jgi:hypothetical protein
MLAGDCKDVTIRFVQVGIAEPAEFAAATKKGLPIPFTSHDSNFKGQSQRHPFGMIPTSVKK